ncbi:hypothetical protein GMRT_14858 [Giardia muris]|uniref:Uncharacterized protein n=1 Tax=Giardia muris TaxID=5742 RepID=A0A4Z1SN22_GIAMU|nr:hypothetical protein GMRT_14858 [Giardia muris]|eukprot:TNJ26235.1 hypothetical protein GMRT_14858 [Giardia muris]
MPSQKVFEHLHTLHFAIKKKLVPVPVALECYQEGQKESLVLRLTDSKVDRLISLSSGVTLGLCSNLDDLHADIQREAPGALQLTIADGLKEYRFIVCHTLPDLQFLVRFLQLFHCAACCDPDALLQAAVYNLSPSVAFDTGIGRLPVASPISMSICDRVSGVIIRNIDTRLKQYTKAQLQNLSYWPLVLVFLIYITFLLSVGPYSHQPYTIAHILSMRTHMINFLLPHTHAVELLREDDDTVGHVDARADRKAGVEIKVLLNPIYFANYAFKHRASTFSEAYRIPSYASGPMIACNRVDIDDSLFGAYATDHLNELQMSSYQVCEVLAKTMPKCFKALEPISVLVRATVLRALGVDPMLVSTACLTYSLQILENLWQQVTYSYLSSWDKTLPPPHLSLDELEDRRISIIFMPGLYEGDVPHLLTSEEYSKALSLQHAMNFLFLPITHRDMPLYFNGQAALPSLIKYVNPDGSLSGVYRVNEHMIPVFGNHKMCTGLQGLRGADALRLPLFPLVDGSLLSHVLQAVSDLLASPTPTVPEAVKALLARATIAARINYGQPSETVGGTDNVLMEFVLSSEKSGGGDPLLFLDAPGSLCPALHFFVATQNFKEERGNLSVYEYWLSLGIKGYPPSAALAPDFFAGQTQTSAFQNGSEAFCDTNQHPMRGTQRLVPEAPVLLIDVNVLPSSRQAFCNMPQNVKAIQEENLNVAGKFYTRRHLVQDRALTEKCANSAADQYYCYIRRRTIEEVYTDPTGKTEPATSPVLEWLPCSLVHFTEAASYVEEGVASGGPLPGADEQGVGTGLDLDDELSTALGTGGRADAGLVAKGSFSSVSLLNIAITGALIRAILQHFSGFARYNLAVMCNAAFRDILALSTTSTVPNRRLSFMRSATGVRTGSKERDSHSQIAAIYKGVSIDVLALLPDRTGVSPHGVKGDARREEGERPRPEFSYGHEETVGQACQYRLISEIQHAVLQKLTVFLRGEEEAGRAVSFTTLDETIRGLVRNELASRHVPGSLTPHPSTTTFAYRENLESLLSTAYNAKVETPLLQLMTANVDAASRLPGRRFIPPTTIRYVQGLLVPWVTIRSLYPEVITFPGLSLHSGGLHAETDTLTVDLGFVPHHGRMALLGFYMSALPAYIAQLRRRYTDLLVLPPITDLDGSFSHYSGPHPPDPHQTPRSYELGGQWLSSLIDNIFNIQGVLITAATYGQPVVSLTHINDVFTLVIRCVDISLEHQGATEDQMQKSNVITDMLTPGLAWEISSLTGLPPQPKMDGKDVFANVFSSLARFTLLSLDIVLAEIAARLRLPLILPLIAAMRDMQYALTNRNAVETVVYIPGPYVTSHHDLLDVFSTLARNIVRCDFRGLPELSRSVKRHAARLLNVSQFLFFSTGTRTEVSLRTPKTVNQEIHPGKVFFSVGLRTALNDVAGGSPSDCSEGLAGLLELNPHLTPYVLSEGMLGLHAEVVIDPPGSDFSVGFGYPTSEAVGECAEYAVAKPGIKPPRELLAFIYPRSRPPSFLTHISASTPILVGVSALFLSRSATVITLASDEISAANVQLNLTLPLPIETEECPTRALERTIFENFASSPQLLPARLQALRYACSDVTGVLRGACLTTLLPFTFGLGELNSSAFIQASSALDFACTFAGRLARDRVLPLTTYYLVHLTRPAVPYHHPTDVPSGGYLPMTLVLVGPVTASLPAAATPVEHCARFLLERSDKEIIEFIESSEQSLFSLVPAVFGSRDCIVSSDGPIDPMTNVPEGDSLFNDRTISEKSLSTFRAAHGLTDEPLQPTPVLADELVRGPYLFLSANPRVWQRLITCLQQTSLSGAVDKYLQHPIVAKDGGASGDAPGAKTLAYASLLLDAKLRHDITLGRCTLTSHLDWRLTNLPFSAALVHEPANR